MSSRPCAESSPASSRSTRAGSPSMAFLRITSCRKRPRDLPSTTTTATITTATTTSPQPGRQPGRSTDSLDSTMPEILTYDFMQRALLAAFLVGLAAPMVGVFLVQRRLSLIGDGMGHVALAGVAVGVFTNQAPVLTAMAFAVVAAVVIELVRARGRTSGDVALAVMFYGGIALGVVVIGRSQSGAPANLDSYLFGAISTTTKSDLLGFAALALVVVAVTWALRPRLFAVANDEEYARATGMRVTALNITLAVLTAVTVVVAMRVVGLLLISALMIVPNATAQLVVGSFRSAIRLAVAIGVICSVGGVTTAYYADTPPAAPSSCWPSRSSWRLRHTAPCTIGSRDGDTSRPSGMSTNTASTVATQ